MGVNPMLRLNLSEAPSQSASSATEKWQQMQANMVDAPPSPFVHASQASSSSLNFFAAKNRRFKSRRVKKEEIQRPWIGEKDRQRVWPLVFPLIGIFLGFVYTGFSIWQGMAASPTLEYCVILDEDFSSGTLDPSVWTHEIAVGGFGNGQFEQTTADDENTYIKDGQLYIRATLQNETLLSTNTTLNLLNNGCTMTSWSDCVAVTNTTNGTIINPVKSARLNTKKKAVIQYGRIEVRAKLPAGDWLWPAIWMLPVNATYGVWPASGEIDIMEARGNNYTYGLGGTNVATSSTHWGPDTTLDRAYKTTAGSPQLHGIYPTDFHTFGLEWTPNYLYTYIDSRVRQVLKLDFSKKHNLFEQGGFPPAWANSTPIQNPWAQGTPAAPFDQPFYLLLNLAVGGSNGWFQDGMAAKPWTDNSVNAKAEFWAAKPSWWPTWQDGVAGKDTSSALIIDSVKMWQLKGYMGCV